MDKTDMLYGPRNYLRRAARAAKPETDSTRQRAGVVAMNKEFIKLEKPRDTRFSSRGGGVVYKDKSKALYHRRKYYCAIQYDATPETRLIRNGEIVREG